ncbi:hypothetical protein EMCRGX_G026489 [Ephydatia muelleri]
MSTASSDLRGRYKYNLFCRLFFLWVEPLLWTGCKRKLMQSDLDVKVEELDSTKLLNTFNWYWNKELERKKRGKPARLGLAIVMCVWWRLIVQGALTFCEIGVQVLQSVVTGLLSQYFVEEYASSTDTRNAYIYAACLVATALVITVLHSIALFIGQKIGLIVRATITAAIHQKIMTLNQATVGLVSAGHVVNLASNDAQRFDQAFIFVHQLWLGPLLLVVFTYLLYAKCNVGLASLIPVEVILIALPIQVLLFRAFSSESSHGNRWQFDDQEYFYNSLNAYIDPKKYYIVQNNTGSKIDHDKQPLIAAKYIEAKQVHTNWSGIDDEKMTLQNISFTVNKDAPFLAVVGPVGSGKSTLLQCVLGELHPVHGTVDVKGKIAYASQDPWLFTGTLRENVLFGCPLYVDWYDAVLDACALHQDIEQLPNGDLTLIGERGVTLSGGQKARVSLARAIYVDYDVYLLDDPLSAVDADRLVVLVTHQLQFAEQANNILALNDGKMVAYGNIQHLRANRVNSEKLLEFKKDDQSNGKSGTDEKSGNSNTVRKATANKSEERSHGNIKAQTYIQYFKMGAGPVNILLVFGMLGLGEASRVIADWWIADWTDCFTLVNDTFPRLNDQDSCHLTRPQRLEIYAGIVIINIILNLGRVASIYVILVKASHALHSKTLASILGFPIRFFDTNPIGRILNYFSKDVSTLDDHLPIQMAEILLVSLRCIAVMLTTAFANEWVLISICFFTVAFFLLRRYYLKTSREIKRLEAIARSPVYSHLSESLLGLSTIRTFGRQQTAQEYFHEYLNQYSQGCYLFIVTTRWFGMRIDGLTTILLAAVAFSCIPLASSLDAGLVGLALTYTVSLSGMFQMCVRYSADVETTMVSAERLLYCSQLETENSLISNAYRKPDPGWPQCGMIIFDNASFRYSADTPVVLKPLSFIVQPGEKVGIIGRTGAGKSSLIQMLFRMAEHTGNISIDGVNIRDVELHELRKSISIIPQDPVLFSGSLKYNLDPFEEYKDSELWNVLEQVQLKSAVEKWDGGIELNVSEGGRNFSIGQRQLICLARAILRKNRILVLDEATANVDFTTDAMIQKILQETFAQCTVLTVAHRLNTVIGLDRIMVMDEGEIAEFDDPYMLLKDEKSLLKTMVDRTGPSNSVQLYQMAEVQPPDQPRNASTELTNDVKCAELGWSCVPLAMRPMEPGVMRHNAPFLTWLLFSLWDLLGPRVRRLVGKCLCQITKGKASDYFSTHQFGVACPSGAEKIVHGLRSCIEEHQNEQDFVVMKIDLRNAFNLVSRQALLDECRAHFPELLQWAAWCYGQHYLLWSPMETIMSESGVQQGDPLGPLLFCLVLQKVLSAIASDPIFFDLLFHAWYIDVGVISGSKQAVVQALSIIQDLGPPLGLVINSSKCELYGDCDLQPFPSEMKKCNAFNFEILGAPIGDTIFCAKFIAEKRAGASKFLALLKEVGSLDSQVALVLLRQCGGFCRFVHIAVSGDCLSLFILSSSFFSLSLANWRKTLSK